jgi:hypothetical protein
MNCIRCVFKFEVLSQNLPGGTVEYVYKNRIAGLRTEICSQDLPNTRQVCCVLLCFAMSTGIYIYRRFETALY